MERLDGRTALITGATDGVGRVVASRLAAAQAYDAQARRSLWQVSAALTGEGAG